MIKAIFFATFDVNEGSPAHAMLTSSLFGS